MMIPMERLDFRLPDFARWSWVSDKARTVWEPRVERINASWRELEWLAVYNGLRACAWQVIDISEWPDLVERMGQYGLSAAALQTTSKSGSGYTTFELEEQPGQAANYRVVIGAEQDVEAFREAWERRDDRAIGTLLGYPTCCQQFFQAVWVEQRFVDTTWAMALNTSAQHKADSHLCEVEGYPEANILLRWMGPRAVPHLPCRFDCAATRELAQKFVALGRNCGFEQEMDWLLEMLNWPVEWSALHGIGEIKTPLFKIAMMTDATAERYTVRRIGHSYPAEGARGLGFPFSQPMQLRLSESIGFQRGLDNPTPPPQEATPQWYFTDNGFHSLEGMNRSHQPLVNLALQVLDGKPGNVLDLGCGNGLLLHKILQGNSSIIPYGVEIHNNKIAHVHSFLPDYTDHFFTGDMFAVEEVWSQRYTLIIIMLGRLLEVEVEKREWLKERLRSASNLLVYVYDDYLSADQTLASLARAAGIELLSEDAGGSLSLARVIS